MSKKERKDKSKGASRGPGPAPSAAGPANRTLFIKVAPAGAVSAAQAASGGKIADYGKGGTLVVEGGEKYRLGRVLAEGGMGLVCEAEDVRCRRTIALKRLLKGEKISEDDRERFVAEAQITSRLEHPNIIPIHELGFDAQRNVYYTMKYIRGKTLTDILMEIRRGNEEIIEAYPLSRLLNIFQKVCDAIAFAHAHRVMHCDLKPDNIMVCDFGEVVVTDWGLARYEGEIPVGHGILPEFEAAEKKLAEKARETHVADAAFKDAPKADTISAVTRTSTGTIMGTPGFMAPERVVNDEIIDTRSDIYSLGATLYSILTLRAPIAGTDMNEMLRRILKGDIIPPAAYNDGEKLAAYGREPKSLEFPHCPERKVPAPLSETVMKALATDPDERYASVRELQSDVEDYQNGLIWHLVLDDDFSNPDVESRWNVVGGTWEIRNGELRLYGGEPQLLILKQGVAGDVRLEFECRQESAYLNDVSCFMSAMPSENVKETAYSGYEFKYGGYDNSMNLLVRGDRRLWSEAASPLVRGKRYKVRAERIGSRLRLVVNNTEVFRVHDADPLSGAARTAVGFFGWVADTRYTRIKVYCLGAPWKSDVLELAERQVQKGNYAMAEAMYREAMESFPDEARMERARRGLQTAKRCAEFAERLPEYRARLECAWPKAKIHLGMDNDGFTLDIADGGVSDLEPVRGIPLRTLYCQSNHITSLEPLRGMPLVSLNCSGNPVGSLDPLQGMPLSTLICEGCGVGSFEPLRGMALTMLVAGGNPARSLEPLRGMPLTNLSAWGGMIDDLSPLEGMRLTVLYCNSNSITDLSPLRGMPLVMLNCSGNRIESLSPLRGMPLKVLHFGQNRVSDISVLRGMKLNMVTFTGNRVRSLEPLRGMPVAVLTCGNNHLASLDPFLEAPMEDFLFDSDSIPSEELRRALELWENNPSRAHLARNVNVLLTLREKGARALRKLAREFGGRRYLFVPKFVTWEKARRLCEEAGGHLAVIRSAKEQGFMESLFVTGCWAWFGMVVDDKGPGWITGEAVTYANFVDRLQERKPGPKVFCGRWASDDVPGSENTFIIQWDD